jgi:hypothetical protein
VHFIFSQRVVGLPLPKNRWAEVLNVFTPLSESEARHPYFQPENFQDPLKFKYKIKYGQLLKRLRQMTIIVTPDYPPR